MTESLDLFVREPVTLDGVVPAFTKEETLLGYEYTKSKICRGLGWNEDDNGEPREIESWSIVVDGKKVHGKTNFYQGHKLDIVLAIVNEVLMSPEPKFVDNTAWKWLKDHELPLKQSIRYWKAMQRIDNIRETERKIQALEQQVRLGKILASVDAIQILENTCYDALEFHRSCREFGMTETEIAQLYS